ncbi:unnamed protein product [Rhizoctonia solani]|uniref:Mediator of RNA polymerase II transcription subunit 9 n=1 Tax=Rhizoctonia solani TaxID=456999 RepID=A0A8H2Y639_9AGAM|nr:unnamed protein product [Rhizoctonia solani]CAE6455423.1 unnamed protein product [Rhizoctonia solani]
MSQPASANPAFNQSTFESLLPSVVQIIQSTQPQSSAQTHQQQQDIAKATMALRTQLATARDQIDALPGGEMLIKDQQEVIHMLQEMRSQRRAQLARLANLSIHTP